MHEKDRELVQTQKVQLQPAGKFEQPAMVTAFRMEDGSLLINTNYRHESQASGATLKIYGRFLNAEQVVIKGKWVFVPDENA